MVFQEVCDDVVRHTDGVLGCFLIDVRRGFAVAAAQRSGVELEDAEIQSVLRSSSDLFRGRLVEQFARSLPNGADAPAEFVQEVQVTKADSYQFMAAMPDWKDGIVILIAENTLSLGFGWMIVRQTQDRLSEALRMVGGDLRRPATEPPPSPVARRVTDPPPPPAARPVADPSPPVARNEAAETHRRQRPQREPQPAPAPQPTPEPRPTPEPPIVTAPPIPPESAEVKAGDPSREARQEPDRPIVSGPRAKMFRPRTGKR